MKALKIVGIIIASILLIFVVVGFLQPKSLDVTATKIIKAPVCVVFDHVNDMKKRVKWSPWVNQDSTMNIVWSEITKGEGASYSWTSENMGTGSMTYKEVVPNQSISSDLNFQEQGIADAGFDFEEVEDGVKVTWNFHTDMGSNPFNRLMGIVMRPMLDASFAQGLESLSEIAAADETNPCITAGTRHLPSLSDAGELLNESNMSEVEIAELILPAFNFIGITDSSSVDAMGENMAKNMGRLSAYFEDNGLVFTTASLTQYVLWEPPTKVVYTSMIPVVEPIQEENGISNGISIETHVVRGTHLGSYESSEATWLAMDAYLEQNDLQMAGNPFEEYVVSPVMTDNPENYVTHIYYPVRAKS